MARVRYIEKSEAAPEALAVYEDIESQAGKVLAPFRALAHSPKLLRDWWKMMVTLLTDLELDAKLRELALLRLFRIIHCDYCFAEHDGVARRAGVTEDQIRDIENFQQSDAFNELERLVLRYTETITRDNTVEDEVFDKLKKHLSERELVELTFCIGNWNGIGRFIVPMALELDSPAKKK